jgi:hypothetical protein
MSLSSISNGTYYITSQVTGTVLTLSGAEDNITAWALFKDPSQQVCPFLFSLSACNADIIFICRSCSDGEWKINQWDVSVAQSDSETYTIKNVLYDTYATGNNIIGQNTSVVNPIYGSSMVYTWTVQEYKGGYL